MLMMVKDWDTDNIGVQEYQNAFENNVTNIVDIDSSPCCFLSNKVKVSTDQNLAKISKIIDKDFKSIPIQLSKSKQHHWMHQLQHTTDVETEALFAS